MIRSSDSVYPHRFQREPPAFPPVSFSESLTNNMSALTTVLFTFPVMLADTFLSHITPEAVLHLFQPAPLYLFPIPAALNC